MDQNVNLKQVVLSLKKDKKAAAVTEDILWYAVRGALNPSTLINNLSEALRLSSSETENLLIEYGMGDLVMQARLKKNGSSEPSRAKDSIRILDHKIQSPFPELFSVEFTPPLDAPLPISPEQKNAINDLVQNLLRSMDKDPFLQLYRSDVNRYLDKFSNTDAPKINQYIEECFGKQGPRYLINCGIGANEQFNHFMAYLHNQKQDKKCRWIIINSPRQLLDLPPDVCVENSLFMEYSRSGITEETIKIHEYTPRSARRIVYANGGPLKKLGERDGNLVLSLPDEVSGRFGRNKTPALLAPMYVSGGEVRSFWNNIDDATQKFDLTKRDNLPFQMAKFIYIHQTLRNINHIYLGCNDEPLLMIADELTQFWNEGVNKGANDILMSRYLGLPRDSHTNIEGILANYPSKMGFFLFSDDIVPEKIHPVISLEIDPINPEHKGIMFGDEEIVLAEANHQRFRELMPCIKVTLHGNLNEKHAAVVSQLWADMTFCYSRLKDIDPGSNPEVKAVRDRAARLLSEYAGKRAR
ncbi:hypothetical protein JW926_02250 [Candidatus Sumerlaeota bacterium]|nr:hypothetical protein [Candidatus Sumerlaeota bacterium]